MKTYKLDNFLDWGRVLEELQELKELGLLDEHQSGLKRILRYRGNWRLREYALECVKEVTAPTKDLVQEICALMCDEDVYPELRMLAVDAIRQLVLANPAMASLPFHREATVFERMKGLVGVPMHPLLQRKIARATEEISAREVSSDERKADVDQRQRREEVAALNTEHGTT